MTLDIDDLANEALEPTWYYFYKAIIALVPDWKSNTLFGEPILFFEAFRRTF